MRGRATLVLSAIGLVVATSSSTMAAQFGSGDRTPRDGACFYEDVEFQGAYFCVESGDDLRDLPRGAGDNISSIRVFGRAEVTAFEDKDFRGDSRRFASDVRDLRRDNWNDQIESVRILGRGNGGGGFGLGGRGQNPEVIVRRAYQDILQRDPDQSGMRLYRSKIIDDGWTEQDVRQALRDSPEYRQLTTMTPAKAQEIVRQAYLNVLNREPDEGSRGYVQQVMREKWTQQDVERELRRSPEFRQR